MSHAAPHYDITGKRIFIAGHRGMVGAALMRQLSDRDCTLLTATRQELDLSHQDATTQWLAENKPDAMIIAAAKVGGILANDTYPATFLYENLAIASHLIEGARQADIGRVVFLGSSCIYPKLADQPISEDALLTGPLEPTNEWYAIAKIAGIKLCQAYRRQYGLDYISAMPTNLYGPHDNFDLTSSHVIPALMRKAHEAKLAGSETMTIWGSGTPRREFMHVDDCASGIIHLLEHYTGERHVNIGCGQDVTIRTLAQTIANVVQFNGTIVGDSTKPDGTPRKLMDSTTLHGMGWQPQISLTDGLSSTYEWFLEHHTGEAAAAA